MVLVTRSYLELRAGERAAAPPAARPTGTADADDAADAAGTADAEPLALAPRRLRAAEYRALYAAVGRAFHWRDRDAWSDAQLQAHLDDPAVHLHLATSRGATVGYVELVHHAAAHEVEIAYFGLVAAAHGRGLGRRLLELALDEGWRLGAQRIWLHTCSLDHPAALPNYQRRGFRVVRTEQYELAQADDDHPPASRAAPPG